jgi:hypothetical protein
MILTGESRNTGGGDPMESNMDHRAEKPLTKGMSHGVAI